MPPNAAMLAGSAALGGARYRQPSARLYPGVRLLRGFGVLRFVGRLIQCDCRCGNRRIVRHHGRRLARLAVGHCDRAQQRRAIFASDFLGQ